MPESPATPLPEVHITATGAERLSRWAATQVTYPYGRDAGNGHIHLRPPLPAELADAVVDFTGRLGASGALWVSGMPTPTGLPRTPDRQYADIREELGPEPWLLGIAGLIGEVISYADWHDGDRVQNLYPLRHEAGRQNASNAVTLEMHTETAFRPNTPDALALLCLRADPGAQTFVCDIARVCAALDVEHAAALAEPAFGFALPEGGLTEPMPVITAAGGRRRYHYADALIAHDAGHAPALDALKDAVHAAAVPVTLRAGDMLLLDNLHMVHGRSSYRPRYDGTDRWLQRCLVRATGPAEGR